MADPKNGEHDDDDDDEEYIDAMDEESNGGGAEPSNTENEQNRPRLSAQKRKAVDQAFEDLFGYAYGTTFLPLNKRRKSRKERILVEMFGPTAAARLLGTTAAVASSTTTETKLILPKKKTVTQVKRFAGTNVTIQTTVEDKPSSSSKPSKKAATGLDLVLDQLDGPNKISTVAKTSADWDRFKGDRGLEEELEKKAQGKDAFLVKKDFLDRVDHRRFEQERTERDKERASRQK